MLNHIKKPSGQMVLSFSFVFIIIVTALFISLISINNEKKAVEDLATQLQKQIFVNIREKLDNYLAMPHRINRLNADSISQNPAIIDCLEELHSVYLRQLKIFETIETIAVGMEKQGNFAGVGRREDGFFTTALMNRDNDSTYRVFMHDSEGKKIRLLTQTPDYDARIRPWYKSAVEAGKPAWSPVYIWASDTDIGITAVMPVYDEEGALMAVQQSALTLGFISTFLQEIQTEKSMQVFISESNGMMVASSDVEKIIRKNHNGFEQIKAMESNTPFIRAASMHLVHQFGDMGSIPDNYKTNMTIDEQRYFIAASTLADPYGLNWTLITGLSENDLLAQIHSNSRDTVLLSIIASIVAVLAALIIARRLASVNRSLEEEISERRLAEDELSIFKIIADNVVYGKVIADTDGQLIYVNKFFADIHGYTPEELIGKPLTICHTANQQEELKQITAAMLQRGHFEQKEFWHVHRNGTTFPMLMSGVVIKDEQNDPKCLAISAVDITDRKQYEKETQKAKEAAEAANRAKSQFLANMSHEIRTPLNGVIGFTELLKDTPLSPVQQLYVGNANVSGHTLLGIINNILDFSKIEAGMLELEVIKTDMIALLENSVDIVTLTADKKNLELLLDIDPTMPQFANVDPVRLKQILANLLGNAVKFTKKGEVELKVGFQKLDNEQGKLSFSVRDTGLGISDTQKEKLFKAFSQADTSTTRKFGGTGLGLIISDMIASKMGSKINIRSAPGVGTTFFFDIITEIEYGEKPDTSQIEQVNSCLIIDDNAKSRVILEQMLKQWHIECVSCGNGYEALNRLEISNPFDVIICDYNMPDNNGLDTIRMIREKLRAEKQAFILLHASSEEHQLFRKCEEMGVHLHLSKPVKSKQLFRTLCNLQQTEKETITPKETERVSDLIKLGDTGRTIKILIADDDAMNMLLIKAILSQLIRDAEISEAINGLQAVERYRANEPDLILMDVQMPEIDGLEATRRIREIEAVTGNYVPIIALTAGALKEEREKCFVAGMDDFLTKPVDLKTAKVTLEKHLSCWEGNINTVPDVNTDNELHIVYSELADRLDNDVQAIQTFLSIAINNIPIKIELIEQGCGEKDYKKINEAAHALKGSALSMSCKLLANISEKIEINAANDHLENLPTLLSEIKAEWKIVKNILTQKIKKQA